MTDDEKFNASLRAAAEGGRTMARRLTQRIKAQQQLRSGMIGVHFTDRFGTA